MPGVYMQGLLIYNADGTIMHEESLSEDLVRETIKLAKELGMSSSKHPASSVTAPPSHDNLTAATYIHSLQCT